MLDFLCIIEIAITSNVTHLYDVYARSNWMLHLLEKPFYEIDTTKMAANNEQWNKNGI